MKAHIAELAELIAHELDVKNSQVRKRPINATTLCSTVAAFS